MQSQASIRLYKKEVLTAEAASPALVATALHKPGDTRVNFSPGILSAELWCMILAFIGWREAAESDPSRRAWRGIALLSPAGFKLVSRVRERMPLQLGHIFYAAERYVNVHHNPMFHPNMELWFMRLLFKKARWHFPEPEYYYQLNGDDEHQHLEHTRNYILAMPRTVDYKKVQFDLHLNLAQRTIMINNEKVLDEVVYEIVAKQWARLWAALSSGRKEMFREALWAIIEDFERSEMEAASDPFNRGLC